MRIHSLLLVLVAYSGCRSDSPKPHESLRSLTANELWISKAQLERSGIEVNTVDEQALTDTVVTSGKIAFDDARVAHVYSPVSGRVTRIFAGLGQQVKRGEALALIQSPDIGIASSDVSKAEADLVAAQHAFDRQQRLLAQGATPQADYEQAEDNYKKAQAELERARQRSRLMGAGTAVTQGFTLRSELEGRVVSRNLSPGMEVQSQYSVGSAQELFTIGTTDVLWLLADVYEVDIPRVKTGSTAHVQVIAVPDRSFDGTVDYISDVLDPTLRTLEARVVLANPEHLLKPEMYATVSIATNPRNALAIPRTAVLRLGEQTVAFVERDTSPDGLVRFLRLPVAIDEQSPSGLVPVRSGLVKGDRVAVSGVQILQSML